MEIVVIGEQNALAVCLDKWDLIAIKNGKTLNSELVNNGKKYPIIFLRDTTFQAMIKKYEKAVPELVEANDQLVKTDMQESLSLAENI